MNLHDLNILLHELLESADKLGKKEDWVTIQIRNALKVK
jgi:hypothetical protein